MNSQAEYGGGVLAISLDFELFWGVRDAGDPQNERNVQQVREVVPQLLELFRRFGVHATWATVGFLFFADRDELIANQPEQQPTYLDADLDQFSYIQRSQHLASDSHFAPDLIREIAAAEGQEIGTHTMSHFYCLEPGQTGEQFRADLQQALAVAAAKDLALTSLVFPKNQWNKDYLQIASDLGVKCYRGNETNWMNRADDRQPHLRRLARLADNYVNLTGSNTYDLAECRQHVPHNFPSSRFLRPATPRFRRLERARMRRIKSGLTDAANNGRLFHLWWHPHNFGNNTEENFEFLTEILQHFAGLQTSHGMESRNLGELSTNLNEGAFA